MSSLQAAALVLIAIEALTALACLVIVSIRLGQERDLRWGVFGFLFGPYAFIWGWKNAERILQRRLMWTWTIATILFVATVTAFSVETYFQRKSDQTAQRTSSQGSVVTSTQEILSYARQFEKTGQPERALGYYREAVRIDPGNSAAWNALASYYERHARYAEAESAYGELLNVPDAPKGETYSSLSRVARAQGHTAEAAEFKRRATSIPASVNAK